MASQLELPTRSRPRFPDLDEVSHLRVTESNPPSSSSDHGLDYERCSALHNAIIKHGWRASGQDIADMPQTTWWQSEHYIPCLTWAEERLQPSVKEFLKRAVLTPPFPDESKGIYNSFFYYCNALAHPDHSSPYEEGEEDLIALYSAGESKTKYHDGIVYNQSRHVCVFNEYDPMNTLMSQQPPPWQPLESVLSVYFDMIERGKAVALHKSVQEPPPMWEVAQPDGSVALQPIFPPREPQQDPASGAKRVGYVFNPWVIVPYASRDLSKTLERWNDLVQAIEERVPSLPQEAHQVEGLYTHQNLLDAGIRTNGFAWNFFTKARKPRCTYLGPGLRLPSAAELISSPTRDVQDEDHPVNPVCVLRGDNMAKSQWGRIDRVPWGLYLDSCNREGLSPFEDGSRLVLPYNIGENGFAKRSDGSPVSWNTELYQIGWNPFILSHSIQLLAIIGHFSAYVRKGMWAVGPEGVAEPTDRFKEADTDMSQWLDTEEDIYPGYTCVLGPDERWW